MADDRWSVYTHPVDQITLHPMQQKWKTTGKIEGQGFQPKRWRKKTVKNSEPFESDKFLILTHVKYRLEICNYATVHLLVFVK